MFSPEHSDCDSAAALLAPYARRPAVRRQRRNGNVLWNFIFASGPDESPKLGKSPGGKPSSSLYLQRCSCTGVYARVSECLASESPQGNQSTNCGRSPKTNPLLLFPEAPSTSSSPNPARAISEIKEPIGSLGVVVAVRRGSARQPRLFQILEVAYSARTSNEMMSIGMVVRPYREE